MNTTVATKIRKLVPPAMQDLGDLKPFYSRFGEMPLISISKNRDRLLDGDIARNS